MIKVSTIQKRLNFSATVERAFKQAKRNDSLQDFVNDAYVIHSEIQKIVDRKQETKETSHAKRVLSKRMNRALGLLEK